MFYRTLHVPHQKLIQNLVVAITRLWTKCLLFVAADYKHFVLICDHYTSMAQIKYEGNMNRIID